MEKSDRQKALITNIIVGVVFLALLVSVSMGLNKYRKNFRNEMAQRLDLEEKMLKMEKERQLMTTEIQFLKDKALESEDEVSGLKEAIVREQEEKAILKDSLDKLESQSKGPMQK